MNLLQLVQGTEQYTSGVQTESSTFWNVKKTYFIEYKINICISQVGQSSQIQAEGDRVPNENSNKLWLARLTKNKREISITKIRNYNCPYRNKNEYKRNTMNNYMTISYDIDELHKFLERQKMQITEEKN